MRVFGSSVVHAPIALLRRLRRRRSRLLAALVNSPVAFGLLILALLAAGWNYLGAESSRDRVAEANAVLVETERLFSAIKDLETGERGFVLTGDRKYLATYESGRSAIEDDLHELAHLIHGDLSGSLTSDRSMVELVTEKRDYAARVVRMREARGFEEAADLVRREEAAHLTDAIRREADAIRNLLVHRVERIQFSDRLRGAVLAALTGAAAWSAAFLLAGLTILRHDEARRSNALLDAVLDNGSMGFGFLDRDLVLQRMNSTLAGIPGFGAAQGRPLLAALPALEPHLGRALAAARGHGTATRDVPLGQTHELAPYRLDVFPVAIEGEDGIREIDGVGLTLSKR